MPDQTPRVPRIRLKGSSHLDVHTAREAGGLAIFGTVADDAERPLARAHVGIALSSKLGLPLALSAANPQSCGGSGTPPSLDGANILAVPTDEAARFCVRLTLATDRYVARIVARSSELVEGATLDVPIDLALPPVTLRFDPERQTLSLDDETTSLDVLASTEDEGVTAAASGLVLSLSNETGNHLAEAKTDGSGRARFAFDSGKLGPPGKGELRVAFAGSNAAGPSRHAFRIERRTRVDIASPDATAGRLPIASPEEGIDIRLIATARCAHRGCLALPGGTIEARVAGRAIVAAAPVDRAEAHLFVTFAAPPTEGAANAASAGVAVTFRYIPDAPWLQPTSDLVLVQPVRGPSPWKRTPLVLAAALVVAWLALARLPVRRPKRNSTSPAWPKSAGSQVAVLDRTPPSQGWAGRVADAHDGIAIARARVAIERRGFDRVDVVVETVSDASGIFSLPPIDAHPGDELVAEGPLHATLRHPLPPSGKLAVSLVSRRRALLDRLVTWARRQGAPYAAAPDPTPAHVRRAAGSNVAVARWASAVEETAYGAGVVDEQAQATVDSLAPFNDHLGPG